MLTLPVIDSSGNICLISFEMQQKLVSPSLITYCNVWTVYSYYINIDTVEFQIALWELTTDKSEIECNVGSSW